MAFSTSSITRRNLVKGSAVAAAAALGASATAAIADETAAPNRVCEILGIEKPVVQAIMNHLTSPQLAAAVSEAGGLGVLATPTREEVQATKELTSKPFAVAEYFFDGETVAWLQEEGVGIVLAVPLGDEVVKQYKEAGFTVLVKVLESTADMMRGYQDQGADILIPIGYGAGGCGPRRDLSCATLLAEYKPVIEIPMLAAGAIVNAQTAAAAVAVGAEGAYAGTRFLMTEESPCSQQAKDVIAAAKAEELVRVEIAYGIIHMNRSERAEQALEMIAQGATIDELTDFTGAAMDMWAAMADGNVDEWAVGMDNAVNMIDSVLPAADVVNDLASAFGC